MTPQTKSTGSYAPQTGTVHLNELPPGASVVGFGHRSGAETHMRCPRAYYLNYEYLGIGITPNPGALYFAVGTAVHHGFGTILLGKGIEAAVVAAHQFLWDTAAYLMLDDDGKTEQDVLVEGLLYSFWVYAWPGFQDNFEVLAVETGAVEYVQLPLEHSDLIAKIASQYGDDWQNHVEDIAEALDSAGIPAPPNEEQYIAIQSRPDAILRNRKTHEVVGVSLKTIDDPSDMRRSQLVNDLQGFMELHYGERILAALASEPVTTQEIADALRVVTEDGLTTPNVSPLDFIHNAQRMLEKIEERAHAARNIPTSIDYIQTIFLVKGVRKQITDETTGWDLEFANRSSDEQTSYDPTKRYRQMSHLCYKYRNSNVEVQAAEVELYKSGPNKGKPKPQDKYDPNCVEESWAYRFFKPGNAGGSALNTKWLTSAIQRDDIREWVDKLNAGQVYPTTMNDTRNVHPMAKIVIFEEPLYKEEHKAAAHVRQQKERFVQIARAKMEMDDVLGDAGQSFDNVLNALDSFFPQHLINCRTPYRCAYHDFCHTPKERLIDFETVPEGFEERVPHHQEEREAKGK
jgi:hypothetical protein